MSGKLIEEWVRKAEEDYAAAAVLSRQRKKLAPDVICFLAQQCAEKYLKAFLTAHHKKVPKIHELTTLLKMAAEIDSSLHLIGDLLADLNSYAVDFRYPGEEATRGEAKHAFRAATETRSILRMKLRI
ncbi:HEPN domain-containing protein [Candidatus Woesearchaeota archaeon]|nr:HEPN domain-containing protein [Candidatus Woesearchaeota archaeon]